MQALSATSLVRRDVVLLVLEDLLGPWPRRLSVTQITSAISRVVAADIGTDLFHSNEALIRREVMESLARLERDRLVLTSSTGASISTKGYERIESLPVADVQMVRSALISGSSD